ncbi:hypothetical protein [Synechococcus sp. ROS8604]|uniref:hypothetical protein n=1 Tax=Synechococcus sp. ROS8604 TaxID=1442557 RepID=UPI0016472CE7|nr:hypothetical protein [Synechococcus sp. ROS8604]
MSVDRHLRVVAATSPADAARLQQEESLRTPGVMKTLVTPRVNLGEGLRQGSR